MDGELDKVFTAQEVRDLKLVFDVYDPTNSECISLSDLRKVLRILGFKCSRQKLQELLKEEDIGKEGVVDFRNLLQLVNRLQGDSYDLYDEIQQAFHLIDCDKDGQLSQNDIHSICKTVGLKLNTADIEGMIEEADQNGDGLISLEEFIDTMKRTALFNN